MTIVQKTSSELASAQLARFLKLHLARRQETADPQSCRGCPRDRWGEAREQHVRTGSDTLCLAKQRRPWHPNARLADCDNTHNRSPPPSGRRPAQWDSIGMCLLVSLGSRRSDSTPGFRAGATTCAAVQRHFVHGPAADQGAALRHALSAEDSPAGQLILTRRWKQG